MPVGGVGYGVSYTSRMINNAASTPGKSITPSPSGSQKTLINDYKSAQRQALQIPLPDGRGANVNILI